MYSNRRGSSRTMVTMNLQKSLDPNSPGHLYKKKHNKQMNFDCLGKIFGNSSMCDVILVADGIEIKAHKVILAICSTFFYFKFVSGASSGLRRVRIENISHRILEAVINYFYTSEVLITEGNVLEMLAAAYNLAVTGLQEACHDFLQSNLNLENCIKTLTAARKYQCLDLISTVHKYVSDNLSDVIKNKEYLELPCEEISDLFRRNVTICLEEKEILNSIIQWVAFDPRQRKDSFSHLIQHVDFSKISREHVLQIIEEHNWAENIPQFMLKYIKSLSAEKSPALSTKRRSRSKILLAVGFKESWTMNIKKYDFENDVWTNGPEIVNIKCGIYARVAIQGTTIYCIDDSKMKCLDFSHNPEKMKWSGCPEMLRSRSSYGVTVVDNAIYTVGGFDNTSNANIEKFDISSKTWYRLADMAQARYNIGLGSSEGHIYAVGGYTNSQGVSNVVECYNTEVDRWYHVPRMSIGRWYPGVGTIGNNLFVVGGSNNDGYCKQVERYDPVEGVWTRLPDMQVARWSPAVVAVNDLVYVIGGSSENSTEIYDTKSNTWSMLTSSLDRMCMGSATLIEHSLIKF